MAIAEVKDVRNSVFINGSPASNGQMIDYGDVIETYDISKGLEESFMSIDQNDDGYLSIEFIEKKESMSIKPHCKVAFKVGPNWPGPNTVLLDSSSKFVALDKKPKSKKVIAIVMKTDDGRYGGSIRLKPAGETSFTKSLKPGMAIHRGDSIRAVDPDYIENPLYAGGLRVGGAIGVIIYLDDMSVLKIRGDAEFEFMKSPSERTIAMTERILWKITKDARKHGFIIQATTSVAGVKG